MPPYTGPIAHYENINGGFRVTYPDGLQVDILANGAAQVVRDPNLQNTNPNVLASTTQLGAMPTTLGTQPIISTNNNTNWLILGALALLVLA